MRFASAFFHLLLRRLFRRGVEHSHACEIEVALERWDALTAAF